jgi:protein CWC15
VVVHTNHLCRQPGQGGDAETEPRDLRAELLAAEAAHFAKTKGLTEPTATSSGAAPKRLLETTPAEDGSECEDADAKRRRILEETREIDADSDGADSESSEDSDDEEDETAELMRELEKIKRERAEQKAKEVCTSLANEDLQWVLTVVQEAEKAAEEQGKREEDIALGNPLLNPRAFNVQRRWDDDVIFKNQARGTEQKGKKEFVNVCIYLAWPLRSILTIFQDLLRSDFHKRFMVSSIIPSSFTR